MGNNQNYESQICRHLDWAEKCQNFNLATAVHDASVDFWSLNGSNLTELVENPKPPENKACHQVDTTHALLSAITPTKQLVDTTQTISDYFTLATMLQQGMYLHAPLPFQTFVGVKTAIHLSYDPSYSWMTVIEAAVKFNLPNLQDALTDYINCSTARGTYTIGGHWSINNMTLLHEDTKVEV